MTMTHLFNVTYTIATQESAANCDYADSGFIIQGVPLRDALQYFDDERTFGFIEADSMPVSVDTPIRSITDTGTPSVDGTQKQLSLHLPKNLTAHSAIRLMNYIKAQ